MRVACLQFSPKLGKVQENIDRANSLLNGVSTRGPEILILPELAFSGYNFPSLEAIKPCLEPTGAGISTQWARATAARLQCIVTVGYPEIASNRFTEKTLVGLEAPALLCYNSTITVSPDGITLAHYRKTHLYYTDETWAQESDTKWLTTSLPVNLTSSLLSGSGPQTVTTFGICMDLNPHQFTASWTLYELATHTLATGTQLLLLSMAWLTSLDSTELAASAIEPDMATLSYWIERLVPLVKNADREVIVVFANRCGEEPGDARYAGTSWVGKVGRGKVQIWGISGRAEEQLLSVETDEEPRWVLSATKKEEAG